MPRCPFGKNKKIPAGCLGCGAYDLDAKHCRRSGAPGGSTIE